MAQSIDLSQLLPSGWKVKPTSDRLLLIAPDPISANLFGEGARNSLRSVAERMNSELCIVLDGREDKAVKRFKVKSQQQTPPEPQSNKPQVSGFIFTPDRLPKRDIELLTPPELMGAIANATVSACLTTVGTNKILLANFAVVPSHGKPYPDMIGSDLTPLWDQSELDRIMAPLDRDGFAYNQEYWTWKWEQQPDGGYTRSRQFLSRHFYDVAFAGVRCRLTIGIE